jgi:serine phosphatase RsbU (regulator of sigma subunit)
MAKQPPTSSHVLQQKLSGHIHSFQESFRTLTKSPTLGNLGGRFVGVLTQIFPDASIQLSHRSRNPHAWEKLAESNTTSGHHTPVFPVGEISTASEIHHTPGNIIIIQRLYDNSFIGLAVMEHSPVAANTDIDIISLRFFLHLLDSAYQDMMYRKNEKGLIFSLKHRILQLNSLIDTGIEVAALRPDMSPHKLALMRAAALTNASKGIVRVTRKKKILEEYTFPEGSTFSSSMEPHHTISTVFTFSEETYTFELFEKESRSGILPFEDTDQLLLDALARQVSASLENLYLHQQALEKERIEQELSVAASIQNKIIPVSLPSVHGYDIAGKNIPSKSVGGDYYDCLLLPDGRYALIVADVTGKGIPAALLVSTLHAYLSAYLEEPIAVQELAWKLNNAIYHASTDDKFVTALIAILTPETGELEYSSAGHNPGYILRTDGTIREIHLGGPPLGAFGTDMPYKSERITIEKGEQLLLYTDGVTEATNEKSELFEQHYSLSEYFQKHKSHRSEKFIEHLITDIKKFTGSAPQSDDITILYLSRNH